MFVTDTINIICKCAYCEVCYTKKNTDTVTFGLLQMVVGPQVFD